MVNKAIDDILVFRKVFDDRFSVYKDKRIGIYGLGENARIIIENSNYHFSCLISRDHVGEFKYGMTVLSIEQAIQKIDVVLIAASFSVTSIIYARICEMVPKEIKILNLYGEILNDVDFIGNDKYWKKTLDQLYNEIDDHDVISFDVFDTIIMRDVLQPIDIFVLIEKRIGIKDFYNIRLMAERICRSNRTEPSLRDIYQEIASQIGFDVKTEELIIKTEIEVELEHIIPRKKVLELFEYAIRKGKKVFFTSDMYLSSSDIRKMLYKCGVRREFEIIVSNEYNTSKMSGGLFEVLKNKVQNKTILHIGDDFEADGSCEDISGISTFLIRSGYDLLATSKYAVLYDSVRNEMDRAYLGFYISECLNDPFAMNATKGKVPIKSEIDIAYLIYPITKLMFDFIIQKACDYDCLIFPSRDGWLLYQMYLRYKTEHNEKHLPDAKYVYASRMGLSRAALTDEKNYRVLLSKLLGDYSQNCRTYFLNQFGIDLLDEFDHSSGELIKEFGYEKLIQRLMEFLPRILLFNKKDRENYIEYLEHTGLFGYEKYAMIDIVSYGTQVYCLSELLGCEVDMIALGSTSIPNAYLSEPRTKTILGNINNVIDGTVVSMSDMSVLHLLLEMLYSAKHGQFLRISDSCVPVFINESVYNDTLLEAVQNGILEIDTEMKNHSYSLSGFSVEFAYAMIRAMLSKFSDIEPNLKKKFMFSDPYAGSFKSVNLVDVL